MTLNPFAGGSGASAAQMRIRIELLVGRCERKEALEPRRIPALDCDAKDVEVAARLEPIERQARCLFDGAVHPAEEEERFHEPGGEGGCGAITVCCVHEYAIELGRAEHLIG